MWYEMIIGAAGRVPHPLVASVADFRGRDWMEIHHGWRIEDWDARSVMRSRLAEHDGAPDDVLANAFGLPVFSERLRWALATADVGVHDMQYLPIWIARFAGEELAGFSLANITTRVGALNATECSAGLDLSYEVIDPATGKAKVRGIQVAALKAELLEGHDVIRLLEFFPPVFVSGRFVSVFDNGGFTGATFVPVTVS